MESLAQIVNGFQPITLFMKSFIVDVRFGSDRQLSLILGAQVRTPYVGMSISGLTQKHLCMILIHYSLVSFLQFFSCYHYHHHYLGICFIYDLWKLAIKWKIYVQCSIQNIYFVHYNILGDRKYVKRKVVKLYLDLFL